MSKRLPPLRAALRTLLTYALALAAVVTWTAAELPV